MPSQLCSCLVVPWRKRRGTVEGRGKRKGLGCRAQKGGPLWLGSISQLVQHVTESLQQSARAVTDMGVTTVSMD